MKIPYLASNNSFLSTINPRPSSQLPRAKGDILSFHPFLLFFSDQQPKTQSKAANSDLVRSWNQQISDIFAWKDKDNKDYNLLVCDSTYQLIVLALLLILIYKCISLLITFKQNFINVRLGGSIAT